MDRFSFELLSLLKNQYLEVVGNRSFMISEEGIKKSARQFYFLNLQDNLITPMLDKSCCSYSKGSGNELNDKMKALRSSSAMTYNLFGNDEAHFHPNNHHLGAGEYQVEFEKQLHTLSIKSSGMPANLDAFLYNKSSQEVIACEMKMMEWLFNKPGKLSMAYLQENNYDDRKTAKVFIETVKALIATVSANEVIAEENGRVEYESIFKQYDAFQMFKHSLACYNYCRENKNKVKKLTLLNCVWELPEYNSLSEETKNLYLLKLENEHREFEQFHDIMKLVIELYEDINIDFDIVYLNAQEFVSMMIKTPEEINYLRRYMMFT